MLQFGPTFGEVNLPIHPLIETLSAGRENRGSDRHRPLLFPLCQFAHVLTVRVWVRSFCSAYVAHARLSLTLLRAARGNHRSWDTMECGTHHRAPFLSMSVEFQPDSLLLRGTFFSAEIAGAVVHIPFERTSFNPQPFLAHHWISISHTNIPSIRES